MKLEDKYAGAMGSVEEFDFEHFVEGSLRNLMKDDDLRAFRYEDVILRPRHLIGLWETLRSTKAELFTARAPVVVFDGKPYEIRSVATDTFEDLLRYVEDLTQSNSRVLLYSVMRNGFVDPNTFEGTVRYKIRFGIIS
ncbi:hypothetical protein D3C72_1226900 [compost metagenome]